MKNFKFVVGLLLAAGLPSLALADIVGPYTADTNTLFLLHFDGVSGSSSVVNAGSKGGVFYAVDETSASATPPTVSTMLGAPGYVNGPTNFNLCMTNPATGYEFGYDYNNSGAYDGDVSYSTPSADQLLMTNLNMGNGGKTPWTLEALIRPTVTGPNQEIISTDNSGWPSSNNSTTNRGFQFRITSGSLQFQFVGGASPSAASGTIPTSGNDAFVAGAWYHVAAVYDGANVTLYWTLLNPTNGAAHVLGSPVAMTIDSLRGAVPGPLIIGNENRNAAGEQFQGCIDEVRISKVARGAGQMQFYSPLVTITANPVSQNVDYNQPVTFSVGASSVGASGQSIPLGYQWRFNSNSIAGATNNFYTIANVTAGNAGYFDCVVTNTLGYSATSTEGHLVVGAANFIADRYSFTTDSSDSIGGRNGTNFGNVTVSGGQLVLDGSSGTYVQLPSGLFTAANATALTVEWWATYGSNPNNVYAFAFGYTNYVASAGIVGIQYLTYSPHNSTGQTLASSPSDPTFAQTASAGGNLDGQTVHVVCVMDPPNKILSIYTNGVLESVNTNFTVNIGNLNDQLSYIGRSLWDADSYLTANLDELRIFKGALSSISIKQSDDQGPNTLLADGPAKFVLLPLNTATPLGQSATFTAAAVGYLPITYQWFKNGVLVPGATNTSYTFIPTLADNLDTIQVYATNTIGVTTYITNSPAVTLSVFVPPTIAWLDSAHGGADNFWNTTSLDWANSANSVVPFSQTNGVLFDSRGSGSPSVDISIAAMPYNIAVNAASDYSFSSSSGLGLLVGQAGITKQNSGRLTIDVTNNLSGPVTVSGGTLQVGNGDSLGSLGSGPVTNNATISLNRTDTALAMGNAIHGSGTLSFDGSGAVTVSGNSDYSGATLINAGIIYLTSATGLGAAGSGTAVANGAQLYITTGVNIAEPLTLNGVGDNNGALRKGGASATTESGAVTLASDSTISVDDGATLTLSNVVSGTAALTATGTGTLTLNTNNTFSGGFTLNGPVVNLNASHALGSGPVTVSGTGRFVIGTGLTITNPIIAGTVSPGTATGLLMVNDNTNGTVTTVSGWLEFDSTPANGNDFMGPTSSGYLNVTGPITNTATGAVGSRLGFVHFSGGGNYSAFSVNEGTTSLGAKNGLATNATLTLGASAAATFDLNGFSQELTGLADGSTNTEFITNSAPAASTLTFNLSGGYSYAGAIGGNVALVENGSGSLYLSGTNTYTGNTTVNGGTLELAEPDLAAGSTVTVASGAVLQLDFSVTNTVNGLVLNGVSQPLGIYSSTTSPLYLSGPGSLQVAVSIASNPTNISFTVTGNQLKLTWPTDHKGWILQAQTNSLATGLTAASNTWFDVSGSTASNTNVITINATNPTVFYRIRKP